MAWLLGLFNNNRFDGAFVGGLLNGFFQLRRHIIDDDLGNFAPHLEYFRAGVNAYSAGGATVFDPHFHDYLLSGGFYDDLYYTLLSID